MAQEDKELIEVDEQSDDSQTPSEMMEAILNGSNSEETIESEVNSEIENESNEPTKEEVTQSEPLITQELADQWGGIAKNYVGKPISSLAKAYESAVQKMNQATQELAELKKVKDVPPPVDIQDEMLDALNLSPEEFTSKLNKVIEKKAEELLEKKGINSTVSDLNKIKVEETQRTTNSYIVNGLKNKLPNKDPQQVIEKFSQSPQGQIFRNSDGSPNVQVQSFYFNNPDAFVDLVTTTIQSIELKTELENVKKNNKQIIYDNVKKVITKTNDRAVEKSKSSIRNNSEVLTEDEKLVQEMVEIAERSS